MTRNRTRTLQVAVLVAAGVSLLILGILLSYFWWFPEIEQHGDVVLIGQSLWTVPTIAIGVSLLVGAVLLALRKPTTASIV